MARKGVRARLGLATEEGRREWDDRIALLVGAAAVIIVLGAIVGAVAMFIRMYLHGTVDSSGNPLRAIFASRLMISAARLTILFLGVYLIVSVLFHMRRGQWLTAAGPLKVMESVQKLTRRVDEQEGHLQESRGETERLKTMVSDLTGELRTAENLLAKAKEQLRQRQAP